MIQHLPFNLHLFEYSCGYFFLWVLPICMPCVCLYLKDTDNALLLSFPSCCQNDFNYTRPIPASPGLQVHAGWLESACEPLGDRSAPRIAPHSGPHLPVRWVSGLSLANSLWEGFQSGVFLILFNKAQNESREGGPFLLFQVRLFCVLLLV